MCYWHNIIEISKGEKRRENKWNKKREHWSAQLSTACCYCCCCAAEGSVARVLTIFFRTWAECLISLSLCVLNSNRIAIYAVKLSGRIKSKLPKFHEIHVDLCRQCPAMPKKCIFHYCNAGKWQTFSAAISKKLKITKSPVQKVPPNSSGIDWTIHTCMHVRKLTLTQTHMHTCTLVRV